MIGKDLQTARQFLDQGDLVAIPTETVYGLAGNALDPKAVSEIFRVKNRPSFDPLIVHTSQLSRISDLVLEIPAQAELLANHFMPGPLTLLLPKHPRLPDIVTAGSDRVAIRIPKHPLTMELLDLLDFPLAAPSANPFGYISPTSAQHVADQLGERISYILDGGDCQVGIESTIIGFESGSPVVYRKGGLSIEDIEQVIGSVRMQPHSTSNPAAPGMLKSHYAPRVPLLLGNLPDLLRQYPNKRVGLISFQEAYPAIPKGQQVVLSPSGDLAEAARALFAGMRRLDQLELDLILAELLPESGLGRAINDRLKRAAATD
ncbi:MAG: threonylcarbamoyl-AMP synthase [Saprospiraceae bacterium]|nr:threonylcarbamoyl-AMP synthase [Saprospiraceae bacterium]